MPQSVLLCVGGAGARIGANFWQQLEAETEAARAAAIDVAMDANYREGRDGRQVPRAIVADLVDGTADAVRSGNAAVIGPKDTLEMPGTSKGHFGAGHYTEGAEVVDHVMDAARRQFESCDHLERINFAFANGGGTGSGLGTLILSKVREEYCDRPLSVTTVMPSALPCDQDNVVAPYNAVLSIHQLVENADRVIMYNNHAVEERLASTAGSAANAAASARYNAVNFDIARDMAVVNGLSRYPALPGMHGTDPMLDATTIPFPRLHFYHTVSAWCDDGDDHTPTTDKADGKKSPADVLPPLLFDCRRSSIHGYTSTEPDTDDDGDVKAGKAEEDKDPRVLAGPKKQAPRKPKAEDTTNHFINREYMSGVVVVAAAGALERSLALPRLRRNIYTQWQLTETHRASFGGGCTAVGHRGTPQRHGGAAATSSAGSPFAVHLVNDSRPKHVFTRMSYEFTAMFRRKAFLHWYTGEGMDEMEFTEAESNVNDLVSEYEPCCGCCYGEFDEEEEEGDFDSEES